MPTTMLMTAMVEMAAVQSVCRSGMTPAKIRRKAAKAAALVAVAMKAVTVLGAPW